MLDEFSLTQRARALWRAHLAAYFDGATHLLGGVSRPFPLAGIAFDQGAPSQQPLNGAEIRVTLQPVTSWSHWAGGTAGDELRAESVMLFSHWVRARRSSGDGDSNLLANKVADALYAILGNPAATVALQREGIQMLRPQPPESLHDKSHMLRLVACEARLVFPVHVR